MMWKWSFVFYYCLQLSYVAPVYTTQELHTTTTLPSKVISFYKKAYSQNFAPDIVFPALLKLQLSDFFYAVQLLLAAFLQKPWVVLGIRENEYTNSIEQQKKLVKYCHMYDLFFEKLFIKKDLHIVLYTVSKNAQKGHTYFFDFLSKSKSTILANFYARYFDLLAASYIDSINQAYRFCDSSDYRKYVLSALYALQTMGDIFAQHLMNTSYEKRYAQHLKHYDQILILLKSEHKNMVQQ